MGPKQDRYVYDYDDVYFVLSISVNFVFFYSRNDE